MAYVNKRIFDTDNALNGSFNGWWGRWQILTYSFFVLSYAIVIGWVNQLLDYSVIEPKWVECNQSEFLSDKFYAIRSVIQRLSGKSKYVFYADAASAASAALNSTELELDFRFNYSLEYGQTVITEFGIFCDLVWFKKLPSYANALGYLIGCLLLGFASDRGGRKIIILACIWTTGIMSIFQLVGNDFVSFVFFQFFIGLFIGGVQASFLPAIVEMFPIKFRAFYGVCFHLVVCLFELLMPWLAFSFKRWQLLQIFVTAPIVLTAILQWFVYESIFWYLAQKEYNKAIEVLTKLAKHNGILFESKFKQAKEFLHAKHSKSMQVDFLPLLRLQDLDLLGKKYPQVDMAELQKQKANSSKVRAFLNSLKGASYRSTNTIYRPLDFIYSPTMLVYVLILSGLWFTNGLTDSMERVKLPRNQDFYLECTFASLSGVLASLLAIVFALIKIGRRWMIFGAYLIIEICFLGSLIADYRYGNAKDAQTDMWLYVLFHLCKFAAYFGLIFLMLITAELFPTSLRCTGMGLCFALRMTGSLISSPDMLDYNTTTHRLCYCLLTLFIGSITLFLPETKTFPLPRSILQIEAMQTTIGTKLRSRKVQLACERRQNEVTRTQQHGGAREFSMNESAATHIKMELLNKPRLLLTAASETSHHDDTALNANETNQRKNNESNCSGGHPESSHQVYDTVTSVHDIEQDDHIYYAEKKDTSQQPLINFDRKLTKILEVPSKNITRNNSIIDIADTQLQSNSKV